jgi:hypothetical protein
VRLPDSLCQQEAVVVTHQDQRPLGITGLTALL